MKKIIFFLATVAMSSIALPLSFPAYANTNSYCQQNGAYGTSYKYLSLSSHRIGETVMFCYGTISRTPIYLTGQSPYQIKDSRGNIIYTAPSLGSLQNAYYVGQTYYGNWNQRNNNGVQVPAGNYSVNGLNFTITDNSMQSNDSEAYLKLDNYSGYAGNIISVHGFQFIPNESIRVELGGNPSTLQFVTADATGSFTTAITVGNMVSNLYTLSASGISSGKTITTSFYVKGYNPTVSPSSYYLLPGNMISFSGSGFAPNDFIYIDGPDGTLLMKSVIKNDGSFTFMDVTQIPFNKAHSNLTYTITGVTSGVIRKVTISVGAYYPNITLSSYYVHKGQSVSLTGTGFAPNETVDLMVNASIVQKMQADGNGNINFSNVTSPLTGSQFTINTVGERSMASSSRTINLAQ